MLDTRRRWHVPFAPVPYAAVRRPPARLGWRTHEANLVVLRALLFRREQLPRLRAFTRPWATGPAAATARCARWADAAPAASSAACFTRRTHRTRRTSARCAALRRPRRSGPARP